MQTLEPTRARRSTRLEHAQMRRVDGTHPFDLLQARFITHRFAPHAHETYAIGVCTEGQVAVRHGGARHVHGPGEVLSLNPGEMHTGEPEGPNGWTYMMMYPGVDLLREAADLLRGRAGPAPILPSPAIPQPLLAVRAQALLRELANGGDPLLGECLLAGFLEQLLTLSANLPVRSTSLSDLNPRVSRVREYLHAHFTRRITIAELSGVAQLSAFHLIRVFRNRVGLPPYMYLEHLRIARAKELLAIGVPLVDAARSTGFGDQSHFTRRFKQVVGLPPGRYARQVLGN